MKKKYVKPELLYERYMLNQHMAAACAVELNSGNIDTCRAEGSETSAFAGLQLFMSNDVCGMQMQTTQTFCYTLSAASIATVGVMGSGG